MKLVRAPIVRLVCLILLTAGLFGCDYASKSAAKATLDRGEVVPVAPALLRGAVELRYVENDDVAFNALRTLGVPRSPGVLIALSSIGIAGMVLTFVAARRRRTGPAAPVSGTDDRGASEAERGGGSERMTHAGLALVASGALGNLVDRIARGYVVDFIHVKGWPVFNVADIAVVAGMALVALAQLRRRGSDAAADP
ncbi:MAG: signal peptidase II [Labilithrix sp.]|nr:signal peptidase II [Labilithrix sp.]